LAKIGLREGRRLQRMPAGVVVMATCQGGDGKQNLITGGGGMFSRMGISRDYF
jgi:hypothetical protein